jgi:hypothetical protein
MQSGSKTLNQKKFHGWTTSGAFDGMEDDLEMLEDDWAMIEDNIEMLDLEVSYHFRKDTLSS